jgi:hypothetical protein
MCTRTPTRRSTALSTAAAPSNPTAPGTPRRLICHNPDAVLADAAAGAELLTFNRATGLKLLQVHGRRPHVGMLHRAANPGNPCPLESACVNNTRVTSVPAITRWILAQSRQAGQAPARTPPHQEQRRRERTEARLDSLGLK